MRAHVYAERKRVSASCVDESSHNQPFLRPTKPAHSTLALRGVLDLILPYSILSYPISPLMAFPQTALESIDT